jgi:hypothetical protein
MAAMSATARRGVGSARLAWSLAVMAVAPQVGSAIYAVVARSEPLEVKDFILPALAFAFVTAAVADTVAPAHLSLWMRPR